MMSVLGDSSDQNTAWELCKQLILQVVLLCIYFVSIIFIFGHLVLLILFGYVFVVKFYDRNSHSDI